MCSRRETPGFGELELELELELEIELELELELEIEIEIEIERERGREIGIGIGMGRERERGRGSRILRCSQSSWLCSNRTQHGTSSALNPMLRFRTGTGWTEMRASPGVARGYA